MATGVKKLMDRFPQCFRLNDLLRFANIIYFVRTVESRWPFPAVGRLSFVKGFDKEPILTPPDKREARFAPLPQDDFPAELQKYRAILLDLDVKGQGKKCQLFVDCIASSSRGVARLVEVPGFDDKRIQICLQAEMVIDTDQHVNKQRDRSEIVSTRIYP
ncbi:unnamed protein product [Dovyalis caffra]|uniref:Uncharacterized protein n=1 Tax=Dovyalis caffra TaxID=77055 RepID=A0AAV1RWE6_9ROSI|nr:unnamed protein product [Dovyalis caffra]